MPHLAAQVDEVGVRVVHRKHDAVGGVQLHHHDRIVQVTRCSKRILPLALLREPGREHQTVLQVDGSRSLVAIVRYGLLLHFAGSRIHSPDFPILAGEQNLGSVPVPASGVDQVREGEGFEGLTGADVPDDDEVVGPGREEDVLGRRVPQNEPDSPLVLEKVHDGLGHVLGEPAVRNLPDFDEAILRGRGDDVVIVRAPGDVEHGTFVTTHEGNIGVDPADFLQRENQKGSASTGLNDDGQELGVDGAEGRVPGGLGHSDVVVALLALGV